MLRRMNKIGVKQQSAAMTVPTTPSLSSVLTMVYFLTLDGNPAPSVALISSWGLVLLSS